VRPLPSNDDSVWPAQLVLLLSAGIRLTALAVLAFKMMTRSSSEPLPGGVNAALALSFAVLALVASAWVGRRDVRGVWLGVALFGVPLVFAATQGRLVSFGAAYAIFCVILLLRAGRAIRLA
jgi:hypothetical protein